MSQVWRELWSLIALILGVAVPVAKGATEFASAFETAGRVTRKATDNWELSVDLDSVAAKLALRKAEQNAAADKEAAAAA